MDRANFLCLLLIVSCLPVSSVSAGSMQPGSGPSSGGSFRAPPQPPRARYVIDARIDLAGLRLSGRQSVSFLNTTAQPIERLAVDWRADDNRTLLVTYDGQALPFPGDREQRPGDGPLLIDLPAPVPSGEPVTLDMEFERGLSGDPDPDAIILTDWHPRLWWGFATHDDFEVRIEASPGYVIGSSGAVDRETGALVADRARSFGLFLGKDMEVMTAESEGVEIRCLHTTAGTGCAELLLSTAVEAIGFYRSWLGMYPHPSLTIVPGVDAPVGGFPVASGLVAIHGQERMDERPPDHWRWITAHEIGHQYWGEWVMERDSPGWLWIGLGICADREFARETGLSDATHCALMDEYVEGVRDGHDTTVAIGETAVAAIDFDFNHVVIHGKGFSIISALACVLGRPMFDRAYRRSLRQFAGGRMGVGEFRAVCEEESGQDLGWFFDQWIRTNRFLAYRVASQQCTESEAGYVSTIEIERLGDLRMPVPVEVEFEDGSTRRRMTERLLQRQVIVFDSASPLREVRLDPDDELAMVVPPPVEAGLRNDIRDLPWTGSGPRALELLQTAENSSLTSADLWGKLGFALYDGQHYPEALVAFRRSAEASEAAEKWAFLGRLWQGHVLDLLGSRDEAVAVYREALELPSDWSIRHDQYGLRSDRAWVEARLEQPFTRPRE